MKGLAGEEGIGLPGAAAPSTFDPENGGHRSPGGHYIQLALTGFGAVPPRGRGCTLAATVAACPVGGFAYSPGDARGSAGMLDHW